MKRIRESLASRITLRVVLYVVVVLGISAYVGNGLVLKVVRAIEENGILYAIGMRRMSIGLTLLSILTLVLITIILRRTIHRLIAPLTTFTHRGRTEGGAGHPAVDAAQTSQLSTVRCQLSTGHLRLIDTCP